MRIWLAHALRRIVYRLEKATIRRDLKRQIPPPQKRFVRFNAAGEVAEIVYLD